MKRYFLIVYISLFLLLSCKGQPVVVVDDIESHWSDFVEIKLYDNSVEKDGNLYPKLAIEISKVVKNNIKKIECLINYDYGYKYFSKEESILLEGDSDQLKKINEGYKIKKNYEYDPVKIIKVPDGQDYDIILHGVKTQAKIIELHYYK